MLPTVSNPSRPPGPVEAEWRSCGACAELFPAAPDQDRCPDCITESSTEKRCKSAHPEDQSHCEGLRNAVRVIDSAGNHASGCIHHAATMLAAIRSARVYPAAVPGAAIEVVNRAAGLHTCPRCWNHGGGER